MQNTVLARKLRPQNFASLVGQEHIKQALTNAIANNRLHHAYLFTGTRGVGKTSIARILAKSLNCETGITANPCNKCSACVEISNGSYPDLLEIDAASRTKVEDTREILEQVNYVPIKGRFKIFLIDEVHMLSTSSFNALLKTLEEPPEYVKFFLATTDPQKLPITVISRCLQFNLQPIPKPQIVEHLAESLQSENIKFEKPALELLATAAEGSLRDALSLTDQAISFCQGDLTRDAVANILGVSPRKYLHNLLVGVIENNPKLIFSTINELENAGSDFGQVLKEVANLFHALGYAQIVPEMLQDKALESEVLLELAQKASAEEIQLYYQFSIEGRRDLILAPDAKCGTEMTFMRMLAFKPIGKDLMQATPNQNIESGVSNNSANSSANNSASTSANTSTDNSANNFASNTTANVAPTNANSNISQPQNKIEQANASQTAEVLQADASEKKNSLNNEAQTPVGFLQTSNNSATIANPIDENQIDAYEQYAQYAQNDYAQSANNVATQPVADNLNSNFSTQATQMPVGFFALENNQDWINLLQQDFLKNRMLKVLLGDICLHSAENGIYKFEVLNKQRAFLTNEQLNEFKNDLQRILQREVKIELLEVQKLSQLTPNQHKNQTLTAQKQAKQHAVLSEPVVQELIKIFDVQLVDNE